MKRIYLDYAATTPVHPEVVKAMLPYFTDNFGNPSSIYSYGQEAKEALEKSRKQVANLINARQEEVVFTGSGTEADNFAIEGVAFANDKKGNHIITGAIEHHAVLETCKFLEQRGFDITYLPVDSYGQISPDDVKEALTSKTILVSVMYANNEIGTIEPISEISKITRNAGVYFHTDAVQAIGHIPINVSSLGIDLLSLSAHKLYGPKGVGALFIRKGTKMVSFMHGGAQERGRRASTENVAGIVGLAKACTLAQEEMEKESMRLIILRDKLVNRILSEIEYTRLNGHPQKRLPNNVNISFKFIEGESMCLNLDLEGICSSTGSACSSSNAEPSHVLTAINLSPQEAYGSLRFTLGRWTVEEDIDRVIEVLSPIVKKLRAMSPLMKNIK
jgi:cysteine desulfurase